MIEEVKIFLSYSHKDNELKNQFVSHLHSLIRTTENLTLWTDDKIIGGQKWGDEIYDKLISADLILLLISPDFIESDYCYNRELKLALEQQQKRKAVVVPIGLRTTNITGMPFIETQMLPSNPRFIKSWGNTDEAFTAVIEALRNTLSCVVTEMKNWNPVTRKEEIRRMVENRKFEDACNKLLDFVNDFSKDESHRNRISMMKADFCDISELRDKGDYLVSVIKARRQLLGEIFEIIDLVIEELKKAA